MKNRLKGKLPKYLIFGLSTLDRLAGSDTESMTVFKQHDLLEFDLVKDHESVTGFPLSGTDVGAGQYYLNFLKETDRFV